MNCCVCVVCLSGCQVSMDLSVYECVSVYVCLLCVYMSVWLIRDPLEMITIEYGENQLNPSGSKRALTAKFFIISKFTQDIIRCDLLQLIRDPLEKINIEYGENRYHCLCMCLYVCVNVCVFLIPKPKLLAYFSRPLDFRRERFFQEIDNPFTCK